MSTNGTDGQTKREIEAGVDVVHRVMRGAEQVVSHNGASQYIAGAGSAACGLAAMNCARLVLGKEHGGLRGEELLQNIVERVNTEVSLFALTTVITIVFQHCSCFPDIIILVKLTGDNFNMCPMVRELAPRGGRHSPSSFIRSITVIG